MSTNEYLIFCKVCGYETTQTLDCDSDGTPLSPNLTCTLCRHCVEQDYHEITLECSVKKGKKPPSFSYYRPVYFNEKFSGSSREEPRPTGNDLRTIIHYHKVLYLSNSFYQRAVDKQCLTKKSIQALLRFINNQDGTNKWSKLYLENWNVLIKLLSNKELPVYTRTERATIAEYMNKISGLWSFWQPITDDTRKSWRFPERKHIPNTNFLIRQLHKLLKFPKKYDILWPIPTTEKCLQELHYYWNEILLEFARRKDHDFMVAFEENPECKPKPNLQKPLTHYFIRGMDPKIIDMSEETVISIQIEERYQDLEQILFNGKPTIDTPGRNREEDQTIGRSPPSFFPMEELYDFEPTMESMDGADWDYFGLGKGKEQYGTFDFGPEIIDS